MLQTVGAVDTNLATNVTREDDRRDSLAKPDDGFRMLEEGLASGILGVFVEPGHQRG